MISGMSYHCYDKKSKSLLKALINIHVDNAIERVGNLDELMVATNIDYEYRGFKTSKLYGHNQNKFLNKHYGALQILKDMPDNEVLWMHDTDIFQMFPFDVPEVNDGLLCLNSRQWKREISDSSMFLTKDAIELLEDFFKFNFTRQYKSGEIYWNRYLRGRKNDNTLNWRFNCKLGNETNNQICPSLRFSESTKPIIGIHIHRFTKSRYDMYFHGKNSQGYKAPEDFKEIFDRHIKVNDNQTYDLLKYGVTLDI